MQSFRPSLSTDTVAWLDLTLARAAQITDHGPRSLAIRRILAVIPVTVGQVSGRSIGETVAGARPALGFPTGPERQETAMDFRTSAGFSTSQQPRACLIAKRDGAAATAVEAAICVAGLSWPAVATQFQCRGRELVKICKSGVLREWWLKRNW